MITQLFANKMFLSLLISFLLAQFLKMVIMSYKEGKLNFWHIFELSQMPSTHTATAIALTTAVYLENGISAIFIIMIAASAYIIDEVIEVEYSVGAHARILNHFMKKSKDGKFKKLRERIGHTAMEVIAGFILGLLVTLIVYYI